MRRIGSSCDPPDFCKQELQRRRRFTIDYKKHKRIGDMQYTAVATCHDNPKTVDIFVQKEYVYQLGLQSGKVFSAGC
jgi:hypothetical protein